MKTKERVLQVTTHEIVWFIFGILIEFFFFFLTIYFYLFKKNFAAFVCEAILGCGGQVVLPPNYLKEAFSHVRSAGNLFF